jgi:hypothetical protein
MPLNTDVVVEFAGRTVGVGVFEPCSVEAADDFL